MFRKATSLSYRQVLVRILLEVSSEIPRFEPLGAADCRLFVGQLFGDGFWTPLEVSDSTIVIPVKLQCLEMLVDELIRQSA